MSLKFTKMHGLGNDFIVIDATKEQVQLTAAMVQQLADRRTGIGFDQLLIIEPADDAHIDFSYRIFNADGQEVEAIYKLAADVIDRIRAGKGPALLELMTYRWTEHCGPNQDLHLGYRPKEEFDTWQARCPIRLHREMLEVDSLLSGSDEKKIKVELSAEIDQAVAFARSSPFPDRSELLHGVYAQ